MKQLVLILLLALLGNLTNASFVQFEEARPVDANTVFAADHGYCHGFAQDQSEESPLDQHHPFKHHGCCPTIALHRSARTAFLAATHGSIAKPSPLPPYTDITYSIYKPPKTVI